MRDNPYILRCYARPSGGHFLAVCVDLDIIVRGDSIPEVKKELTDSIKSYLDSLDKENIQDVFPRPAPLAIKAEYHAICLLVNCMKFIKSVRTGFYIFCELATPQGFKVTPCV